MNLITILVTLSIITSIVAIIKGFFRKVFGFLLFVGILYMGYWFTTNGYTPENFVEKTTQNVKTFFTKEDQQSTPPISETPTVSETPEAPEQDPENFVPRLLGDEQSNVLGNETTAVNFGATLVLGELDNGRATSAHILVSDSQEPGQNGLKREGKINTDPAGWKNYKLDGKWLNDRTHLAGYQFSGVMEDPRNLVTATAYLNRGVEGGGGSDQNNVNSMLYYEQQLDSWLANHPNFKLDYYIKPIYQGNNLVPTSIYMQWVGVDSEGATIPIVIGGNSYNVKDDYYAVELVNHSPSYNIDYTTGHITKK